MINIVGLNLQSLTQKDLGTGINVNHLDASSNRLHKGLQFKPFINLVTLVIDDNAFSILTDFPIFKHLQTFSANKNDFSDLQGFLQDAYDRFGNLKNLSLLKNPLNPFFQGEERYIIYRDKVLESFPNLKTMDGCAVKLIKKEKALQDKQHEQKYEKLSGVAVYDQKYTSQQVKSVKTRSEGNRFLKNNQL